ncbi:MAG: hypothetical protein GX357_00400 [Firmicutes bacterium]|nr:hypothetical protein [Bacillota bacterium]
MTIAQNQIKLYIGKVDYLHGICELNEIANCPKTLSPALPPAGVNVIATDHSFFVFSHTQICKINLGNYTAEILLDIATLSGTDYFKNENKKDFLFHRIGFYDGKLLVTIVGDWQLYTENYYLCLIDDTGFVATIKADSEYILPNLAS